MHTVTTILRTLLIALVMVAVPAGAQTSKTKQKAKTTATKKSQPAKNTQTKKPATISGLKNERAQVKKNIATQEQRLRNNERDVKKRLQELVIINGEIKGKRKTIDSLRVCIKATEADLSRLGSNIAELERELADRKEKYVKSLRYMHRNRSIQTQLMFIFSANTLSQMYRRMRFTREYAAYQRAQGEAVKAKQEQLEEARRQMASLKRRQSALLARGVEEQGQLESRQQEQEGMVASLRKQQKDIQKVIAEQKKRDAEINAEIDRLVAIEVEKARKRAEEEAAKRRAAAAKKEASGGTSSSTKSEEKWNTNLDAADRKLSGSFASNKGKLPMPVTGSYRIVSHYGTYNVDGLKNVQLENKGIDILCRPGAKARCVFDGEVTAVVNAGGTTGVMVRHGSYISVYFNLSTVSVKRGQHVTARQVLGTVGNDNILQFQLRNERTKLNPESWLAK